MSMGKLQPPSEFLDDGNTFPVDDDDIENLRAREDILRAFFNANHDDYMAYWDAELELKLANFQLAPEHMPTIESVIKTSRPACFEAAQDGHVFDFRAYPVISALGGCRGVALFAHDISARKAAENEVHRLAYFDPLTGLANRTLLTDRLSQAITSARRHGHAGAVLYLDLDRFKNINDSLGHNVGDLLLKAAAERLEFCRGDEDTVARMGGDEFIWMLPELGSSADRAAERLLFQFRNSVKIGEFDLRIASSIGITIFDAESPDTDEVLAQAEAAMYRAKRSGDGNVQLYRPQMQDAAMERLRLEIKLHDAVEHNRLELYFQPQTTVSDNKVVGVETLLRWNDPELGFVRPDKFIAVAEETGLILQIGAWILDTACRQIHAWNQLPGGSPVPRVAVNISPVQFRQADFVAMVETAMHRWNIGSNQLELELTEGIVIEHVDDTIRKMNELQSLGVRFAIDDFGTGYSSLAYLKALPLDILKIDQSFIQDIEKDGSSAAIVSSIISMGQALSFELIAEGVETEAQLAFLKTRGCGIYQGYLFSRPVPIDALNALLGKTPKGGI